MAQQVVTSFLSTNIPGAYPNVNVLTQPTGLGSSGIVVIMGEADGGPSYSQVVLKNNTFAPNQLAKVTNQYTSGQIVDAMGALSAPSNDPDITGSANLIYIIKTNTSGQASALVAAQTSSPSTYGTFKDLNYGVRGNGYQYQVTETQAEVAPTVTGGTIPSMGATSNASFTMRLNGGAATVITAGSGPYTTAAQLAASFTGTPSGVTITGTSSAPYTLTIMVNADPYANSSGWGKDFELVDSTPGDLAALGLVAGITTSADEPSVEVTVVNTATGLNENLEVAPSIVMLIGYQGTTATMTINQATGLLTTTVAGGSGANLSVKMGQYNTIAQLASYINAQTGYTAMSTGAGTQLSPVALDDVTAIGICSTATALTPGRVKNSLQLFEQVLGTSTAIGFTATAVAGLPAPTTMPIFLAGGTRGATAPVDIVNCLAQLAGVNVNMIIPLFSQDATNDIALGLTDASSTYTIAAINAAVKNHCITYSTPKLKKNRIAFLSYFDPTNNVYQNAVSQAQSLANYRCSLCIQQSTQVNSGDVVTTFMPWYLSTIAAGMQAGGFYKSITNKLANVISFIDPIGFDSGDPGDVSAALNAGLLILNNTNAGNPWVSDQTTYGIDSNFVYNSIQAVYDSDLIALDLAASFQSAFVGQSLADVDASSALGFLSQKMSGYKKLKLIASSTDAPLGWKNPNIDILAPEMDVSVEIKLATAIYFIPININISQVQQSAS